MATYKKNVRFQQDLYIDKQQPNCQNCCNFVLQNFTINNLK